jgi:hypothetical protein
MPAGDAKLAQIYEAMAAWEQAELVSADVERASELRAFAYFPTQADVNAGLEYPYTIHGCETTNYQRVSVSDTPSVTVFNTHVIWAAVIFGRDDNPLDALSARDAGWREAYLEGFVKHMQLMAGDVALVAQMTLLSATPLAFDLFSRPEVGVRFNIEVVSRRRLTTAL